VLNKDYAYRLEVMMFAAIAIIFILVGRMAYLQIYKGDYYSKRAEGNRTRYTRIIAPRGIIYDCNGEELVNNKPGFIIALTRSNGKYKPELLNRLSTLLKMPQAKIEEIIEKSKDGNEPIRLVRDASPELVTKIEENIMYLPGVLIEVQPVRSYLNNELAVHALGYVGEVSEYEIEEKVYPDLKAGDIVGKFGLENYYDSYLEVLMVALEKK